MPRNDYDFKQTVDKLGFKYIRTRSLIIKRFGGVQKWQQMLRENS